MSHKVLVVDDEAHIVQVLSLKLRNAGFEVITACDGEEGYEVATSNPPDIIITDFQMPYMTGLEMCQALAQNSLTRHIPVLLLTARVYALESVELGNGNIKEVISKPFSPGAIVQQVYDLLGAN